MLCCNVFVFSVVIAVETCTRAAFILRSVYCGSSNAVFVEFTVPSCRWTLATCRRYTPPHMTLSWLLMPGIITGLCYPRSDVNLAPSRFMTASMATYIFATKVVHVYVICNM